MQPGDARYRPTRAVCDVRYTDSGYGRTADHRHCSFFVDVGTGGVEPLFNKFRSYSHTEWLDRNASKLEYIRKVVDEGRDLFEEHYGDR